MNRLLKSFLLAIAALIAIVLEFLILNIIDYLFGDVYIIVLGVFSFGVLWWLIYSITKR